MNNDILYTKPMLEPANYPDVLKVADIQAHWLRSREDRVVRRGNAFGAFFRSTVYSYGINIQIVNDRQFLEGQRALRG